MLYIHAFQSYIFNRAASYRIASFGLSVIPGDLVMVKDSNQAEAANYNDAEYEAEGGDRKADEEPDTNITDRVPAGYRIAIASEEDVVSNRYNIADVVLPLLGNKIELPTNAIREYMLNLLAEEELEYSAFTNKKQPQYSLSGAYRRVIEMPQDFQWSIQTYTNSNQHLLPTDLDLLQENADNVHPADDEAQGPAAKALCLEFTLRPSTYATMFLRELSKQPTDVEHHAKMTADINRSGPKRVLEGGEDESIGTTTSAEAQDSKRLKS